MAAGDREDNLFHLYKLWVFLGGIWVPMILVPPSFGTTTGLWLLLIIIIFSKAPLPLSVPKMSYTLRICSLLLSVNKFSLRKVHSIILTATVMLTIQMTAQLQSLADLSSAFLTKSNGLPEIWMPPWHLKINTFRSKFIIFPSLQNLLLLLRAFLV